MNKEKIPNGGVPPLRYCLDKENKKNTNNNNKIKPFAFNPDNQSNLNIRDILTKKTKTFDLDDQVEDELIVVSEI